MEHHLKCWPHEQDAVIACTKTFEVRSNTDRSFAEGDLLHLHRWDPAPQGQHWNKYGAYIDPTGEAVGQREEAKTVTVRVTYVLHGGRFGLPPGVCVMAISLVDQP